MKKLYTVRNRWIIYDCPLTGLLLRTFQRWGNLFLIPSICVWFRKLVCFLYWSKRESEGKKKGKKRKYHNWESEIHQTLITMATNTNPLQFSHFCRLQLVLTLENWTKTSNFHIGCMQISPDYDHCFHSNIEGIEKRPRIIP